ncbi:cleavage stimulation factor subunit 2 protein [Dioscorea alata]|uniref:Cleavage stimulation factor subunit 2 protein n=1 Tax=Dioscorea alata TaxID=55571 RepID=A0ACB7W096_DIOAL|nr:cleavage stimulation factor subunit 2 protein [Dioscorea alata]
MATAAGSQHRCVFVGNIPYDATEEQLIQICEEVGPVVTFRLVLDRETGKPKGYGFCEYKDEETALSARRNLQGYEINGRQLRVDFAENDKGSDRNREQGRGGPGLMPNTDTSKPVSGPPLPGDLSVHQPAGLQLAAVASTVMAGALGGSQTLGSSLQNGSQNQSSAGNDPLTHYLAKMSKFQLNEVLSELKTLATNNKALAQQLLQGYMQLPKAIFQAQIMLGLVSPQMLQMVRPQQPQQLAFQNGMQDLKPAVPLYPGQTTLQIPLQNDGHSAMLLRPPDILLSNNPQNPIPIQQSSLPPLSVPTRPRFQHQASLQAPVISQEAMPGLSGVGKIPPAQPQSLGGHPIPPQASSLTSFKGLKAPLPPSMVRQSRPAHLGYHAQPALPDTNLHQSLPAHALTSQSRPSNYSTVTGRVEMLPSEPGTSTSFGHESNWVPRANIHSNSGVGSMEPSGIRGDIAESIGRPLKLARSEHGSFAPRVNSTSGSQMHGMEGTQQSEKQTPQIPLEVESALLQQVMNLTPEQLSSLPAEQREQVLELQKAMSLKLLSTRNQ